MRSAALRWGYLLAGLLFLLALLGVRGQMERARYRALRSEHAALVARAAALEAAYAEATSPARVLAWARAHGFVPLAEGRWAR